VRRNIEEIRKGREETLKGNCRKKETREKLRTRSPSIREKNDGAK
jgi:hypothetical protein